MRPSQLVLNQYRESRRRREQDLDTGSPPGPDSSDEDLLSRVRLVLNQDVAPDAMEYLDELESKWNKPIEDVFYTFDGIAYKSTTFLESAVEIFAKLNSWPKGVDLLRQTKTSEMRAQWSSHIAKIALNSIATEEGRKKAGGNEDDEGPTGYEDWAVSSCASRSPASRTATVSTGISVPSSRQKRAKNDDGGTCTPKAKKARLERHNSAKNGWNDLSHAKSAKKEAHRRLRVANKASQSPASADPASLHVSTANDADHRGWRSISRLDGASAPSSTVRPRRRATAHVEYTAASRRNLQNADEVPDLGCPKNMPRPSRRKEAAGSEAESPHGTRPSHGQSSGSPDKSRLSNFSVISRPHINVESLPDFTPTAATDPCPDAMLHQIRGFADLDACSHDRLISDKWLDDHFVNTVLDVFNPDPTTWYTVESLTFNLELTHARQRPKAPGLFCQRKMIFPIFTGAHWILGFVDCEHAICTIYDSLRSKCGVKEKMVLAMQRYVQSLGICTRELVLQPTDGHALRQSNSDDCGLYLVLHALHVMHGLPLAGLHPPEWRRILAPMFSIQASECAAEPVGSRGISQADLCRTMESHMRSLHQHMVLSPVANGQKRRLQDLQNKEAGLTKIQEWLAAAPPPGEIWEPNFRQIATTMSAEANVMLVRREKTAIAIRRIASLVSACDSTVQQWSPMNQILSGHAGDVGACAESEGMRNAEGDEDGNGPARACAGPVLADVVRSLFGASDLLRPPGASERVCCLACRRHVDQILKAVMPILVNTRPRLDHANRSIEDRCMLGRPAVSAVGADAVWGAASKIWSD